MRRRHVKPENLGKLAEFFVSEVAMNAKFRSDARDEDFLIGLSLKDNALYYA
jgi:hypothetical protein